MKVAVHVRVCRAKRSPGGFVLRINGATLGFQRRKDAIEAAESWAGAQSVQVVTREVFEAWQRQQRAKASKRFVVRHGEGRGA